MSRRLPHPITLLGGVAGAAIALAPNMLPRPAIVQAILLTVLLLIGAGIGAGIAAVLPKRIKNCSNTIRWWAAGVAVGLGGALFAQAVAWQDSLRAAVGMTPVDAIWMTTVLAVPAALVAVGYLIPTAVRRTAAALRGARRIRLVAATIAATAAVGAFAAPAMAAVPPSPSKVATEFVTADARPDSLRVYGSLSASSFTEQAQDLVQQWQSRGGLARKAVVVAVPTGSGWVDADAVRGFEQRFDGDVGIIALQYSDVPSWQAFIKDPAPAKDSAAALTRAVIDALKPIPPQQRPSLYVYGQSLGSIGADAARTTAERDGDAALICQTVVVGPPAGSVPLNAPHTLYIANSSDPVVHWEPSTLWQDPDEPGTTSRDLPKPTWLPGVSFLQTSADLLGSLSFPAGHGHQYGTEQGLQVSDCGPSRAKAGPPTIQPVIGPSAAS